MTIRKATMQQLVPGHDRQATRIFFFDTSEALATVLDPAYWSNLADPAKVELQSGDKIVVSQFTYPENARRIQDRDRKRLVVAYAHLTVIDMVPGVGVYFEVDLVKVIQRAVQAVAKPVVPAYQPPQVVTVERLAPPAPIPPAPPVAPAQMPAAQMPAAPEPAAGDQGQGATTAATDKTAYDIRHKGGGDYVVRDVKLNEIAIFKRADHLEGEVNRAKEAALAFLDAHRASPELIAATVEAVKDAGGGEKQAA